MPRRPAPGLPPRTFEVPGRLELPEAGAALVARHLDARGYDLPHEPTRAAFDAEAVGPSLLVRARCAGERWTPWGSGERRIKGFLIDARVERWDRARVPLVEARGEVLWLAGLRRSAAAPVTQRTTTVLELALEPLAQR